MSNNHYLFFFVLDLTPILLQIRKTETGYAIMFWFFLKTILYLKQVLHVKYNA